MDNGFLAACGVGPKMPGRATPYDLQGLQELVPDAIGEAQRYLKAREAEHEQKVAATLEPYRKRLRHWQQEALFAGARPDKDAVNLTASRRFNLVKSLETAGEPMLRLLAVLEGNATR
jgi:hypothetical protein